MLGIVPGVGGRGRRRWQQDIKETLNIRWERRENLPEARVFITGCDKSNVSQGK
uniref:Uncharacterized protein n=1 Tax=Arion vulgaris TaxID=1028688 RepID=A0A0B7AR06_9EUPU